MKQYLLDANVLGAYLQKRPGALSLSDMQIYVVQCVRLMDRDSLETLMQLLPPLRSIMDLPW
jgi:hypothetical protein